MCSSTCSLRSTTSPCPHRRIPARAAESSVSSSEHEALKQEHEALRREHEALQREHAALLQSREQHDASEAQLSLARSLLEPLLALEKLASFEEVRCAESPVLPALVKTAARFHRALGEHAIEGVTPVPGEAYDAAVHELARVRASAAATPSVAASSSSSSSAAAAAGAESGAGLAVVECHLPGLRHTPTGTVLRRAIVVAKPSEDHRPRSGKATATAAATAPSPGAPAATPPQQADGGSGSGQPAVHVLQPNDTIQGVALKYGVSPAALIRLNKLPGGDKTALHLRTSVAIPPPPPPSNSTTAAAAAAAARRAARAPRSSAGGSTRRTRWRWMPTTMRMRMTMTMTARQRRAAARGAFCSKARPCEPHAPPRRSRR